VYLIIPEMCQGHKIRYIHFLYSEWLLFNANSAIFQLYHGENK